MRRSAILECPVHATEALDRFLADLKQQAAAAGVSPRPNARRPAELSLTAARLAIARPKLEAVGELFELHHANFAALPTAFFKVSEMS